MPARADVFISATSRDLGKARQVVRDALLDLNCHPVVQEHFGLNHGEIAKGQAEKIMQSHAVLHLAGERYGVEPKRRPDAAEPRSYTQMEYDTALEAGKPLYLFLATSAFYKDPKNLPHGYVNDESPELQDRQAKHCRAVRESDRLWFEFSSLEELRDQVSRLRLKDELWQGAERIGRRRQLIITAAVLVLLGILVLAATQLRRDVQDQAKVSKEHADEAKRHTVAIEETREALRGLKQELANAPQKEGLTEEQRYEHALRVVAARNNVSPEALIKSITQFVDETRTDPNRSPADDELRSVAQKFILKGFTPEEFTGYVESLAFSKWKPEFLVLHHTYQPTLEQWRRAKPENALRNLQRFYVTDRGWTGGPHLFVDDTRVWVFNDLTQPGIHARVWNKVSIGVEMVGNYDEQEPDERLLSNTVKAIAALSKELGLPPESLRFHRDEPNSRRDCPGAKVNKQVIIDRVAAELRAAE